MTDHPTLHDLEDLANWTQDIADHLRRAAILLSHLDGRDAPRITEGGTFAEDAETVANMAQDYTAEAAYALGRLHERKEAIR